MQCTCCINQAHAACLTMCGRHAQPLAQHAGGCELRTCSCRVQRQIWRMCAQVVVRVRPRNAREMGNNDPEVVRVDEDDPRCLLVRGFLSIYFAVCKSPCNCQTPPLRMP